MTPNLRALITINDDPGEDMYKLMSIMKNGYKNLTIFYLSNIPNDWRQEMAVFLFYLCGRNLTEDLKSLLSKDVHDLITAIMTPPTIYQCTVLNYYLKRPVTDKRLLLEILCTVSKSEIAQIVKTYETLYDRTLAEHMSSKTSDDFRRLLTHIITEAQYVDTIMDSDRAWEAVLLLDHEGPAMWGLDDGTFVQVLASESFEMIRLIFSMYKNMKGRTIEEVIRNEMYGELKIAMSAIVNCIMNPAEFLARKLHGVMSGSDTDDNAMVRIIAGRAERDLPDIKRAYDTLYNKTLQTAIVDFSEWNGSSSLLRNASLRRFVSVFYKTRNVKARRVAEKLFFFTLIHEDLF